MKTITLMFDSKKQLLEFFSTMGKVAFAIDLKKLILTSSFSPTDVLSAVKKYDAKILARTTTRLFAEENYC
jgi:hypothetical protein